MIIAVAVATIAGGWWGGGALGVWLLYKQL